MYWLFYDMYRAVTETVNEPMIYSTRRDSWQLDMPLQLPTWIIVMHLLAETTIFVLNFVWFNKMVSLLLRRIKGSNANIAGTSSSTTNRAANGTADGKAKVSPSNKTEMSRGAILVLLQHPESFSYWE